MFRASTKTQRRSSNGNSSSNTSKKRPRSEVQDDVDSICIFCGQVPAAVAVQLPVLLRRKREATPYCLTCYYTTSAVRQEPAKYVSVLNQEQFDLQLVPTQQLFSEAYSDLRKQLQEESDRAFSAQKSDPLAMLHAFGGAAPRRMMSTKGMSSTAASVRAPKAHSDKRKNGKITDGGFLRSIPLPERLLRTQQEQAKLQQAQIARMNELSQDNRNVYQRRKSSKKSIWNLAMDPSTKAVDASERGPNMDHIPTCACGSKNVRSFGNITSRSQDLKKGETWGSKDRQDDIVSRFQCNDCGKMWNEED